jgi:hypothetical protein
MPSAVSQKVALVQNTFELLAEKAMIELLGASNMYRREAATFAVSFENNQVQISGTLQFRVSMWVGLDIPKEDIAHDAQYVLNVLSAAQGVSVSKCEINTEEGTLIIQFSC